MKLNRLMLDELRMLERRFTGIGDHHLDKHKRWEAKQHLEFTRAEIKRRSGFRGMLFRLSRLTGE